MLKKLGIILLLIFSVGCAERELGGISLGDNLQTVLKKYPSLPEWKYYDPGTNPYPISVINRDRAWKAESGKLDIQFFLNDNKRVSSIVAFFYDKEDEAVYETGAGLRPGDTTVELKLLYGAPKEISEFVYVDLQENREVIRIYYYSGLCVHTKKINDLDEVITSLVVGRYDLQRVLSKKNLQIDRPNGNS